MEFLDSLDIGNRALQHCGVPQIEDVAEDSKANKEVAFSYGKLRRAELRRNTWTFSVKLAVLRAIDTTTMLLRPSAYDSTRTYLLGEIVVDDNGQMWVSNAAANLNNTPGDTDWWDMYFGPLSVSLWDSTQSYFAGELVYVAGAIAGSYTIYASLESSNTDVPGTATAWSSTTTYNPDDVVTYGGSMWRSLVPVNLGVTPADGPVAFDPTATYSAAQTVTGSDNFIYSSVGNGNIGHDPVTDDGTYWTSTDVVNGWSRTPTVATSATTWRVIRGTLASLAMRYPIGTGPVSQASTRNVFRLPAGYLRYAAQDPKQGSNSQLGAPTNSIYNDWIFSGDFIVSRDVGPIIFRFVADITDVQRMDDMFCEGLACRIAEAVCEPLTQSSEKLRSIASEYQKFMGEARLVNAIEQGTEESPLDDFLACRY